MSNLTVNIVSFDMPYPANYGGVIDVFYKLKALHKNEVKIIFHCFLYGNRDKNIELEKYCEKVFYYPRKKITNPFSFIPFIVGSRSNKTLITNLTANNYPIIFEGLHSCYYLKHPLLSNRKKFVRTHNIEHHYYWHLFLVERNLFKRIYFLYEAFLLLMFERNLKHATKLFSISKKDEYYLNNKYNNAALIPVFTGNNQVIGGIEAKERFCLYHGKLSVAENNEAACFLVKEVFGNLESKLIIAGNNPTPELQQLVQKNKNITLLNTDNNEKITQLIKEAHINILPTFQDTGIKLKLLFALYNGKHVLVNNKMVLNTGLENLCKIANNANEFITAVNQLTYMPYTMDDNKKRLEVLSKNFNDYTNAQKLIEAIRTDL